MWEVEHECHGRDEMIIMEVRKERRYSKQRKEMHEVPAGIQETTSPTLAG